MQKAKTRKKGFVLNLKYKLILASSFLILISVISLALAFIQRQKIQSRQQLLTRGATVARLMAYNARYGVQIGDKPILDKIVGGITDDPDVVYCLVTGKAGAVITSYSAEKADLDKLKPFLAVSEKKEFVYHNSKGEEVINIAMPVVLPTAAKQESGEEEGEGGLFGEESEEGSGGGESAAASPGAQAGSGEFRVIGSVQIGVTLANMKKEIAESIGRTVLYSAIIFVCGFALAFWLGSLISAPIRKVVTLLSDISEGEGDLGQRIHIKSNDETGDLAQGFNAFMDKFQEIKKISVFLNELADGGGDLTKRLNIRSQDEIGMLAQGFDRFTDKLHEIVCQVAANTEKIAEASQMVSDAAVRLARDLQDMAQRSGEAAQSSSQMLQSIRKTNDHVSSINELMNTTETSSKEGGEVVHETRNGMVQMSGTIKASSDVVAKLNDSSQKISDTITAITEIADQTRLIAINAAIEASRVGAQGKGFAVVAEEIRRLAGRVSKATEEISVRIKAIQDDATRVVDAMSKGVDEANRGLELSSKSEEALRSISGNVSDARAGTNAIAVASNEQLSSINIVSKNITSISESAIQSSEGVSRAAQSMQELNKQVQALRQVVGRFVLAR